MYTDIFDTKDFHFCTLTQLQVSHTDNSLRLFIPSDWRLFLYVIRKVNHISRVHPRGHETHRLQQVCLHLPMRHDQVQLNRHSPNCM